MIRKRLCDYNRFLFYATKDTGVHNRWDTYKIYKIYRRTINLFFLILPVIQTGKLNSTFFENICGTRVYTGTITDST